MFLRIIHSSLEWWERRIKRAIELQAVSLQATQIFDFVVGLLGLPATPKNSYPFESQLAERHPFTFSVVNLVFIEKAGPLAFADRALGKLYQALMKENRPRIAKMNHFLVATLLSD